jgi:hypothetical protein
MTPSGATILLLLLFFLRESIIKIIRAKVGHRGQK